MADTKDKLNAKMDTIQKQLFEYKDVTRTMFDNVDLRFFDFLIHSIQLGHLVTGISQIDHPWYYV